MTSPYSRPLTDPSEHTIRVLHLTPQHRLTDSGVSGSLKETSLDNPIPYCALSYRWGAREAHVPVTLNNGTTVKVTANGYDALVALCRQGREFNLWMDAICIDQSNNIEKNLQVAMMDRVYSKADKVIVWLGDSREDTDYALDWCKAVSRRYGSGVLAKMSAKPNLLDRRERRLAALQAREFIIKIWVRLRSRLLQEPDVEFKSVPRSVQSLFVREWFSRMWTVQEVALAQEPLVMCGGKSIFWSHLVDGIQHASNIDKASRTMIARTAVDCVQFFWLCLVQQNMYQTDERFYRWLPLVGSRRSINTLRWIQWIWTQALKATVAFIVVRRLFSGHWRLENHDVDAWVLIVLSFSFIPIQLYFDPPMELIENRRSPLHDSLVVNINRVRQREAGDLRDKVFALYGTLRQLNVTLDLPQYGPDVGVADVYHRFTVCFIEWHKRLDILFEASWPPIPGAPTWVPDLGRPYERGNVHKFKAAGTSLPEYWFTGDRYLHTTGLRLGTVSSTWLDHDKRDRCRFRTIDGEYTGMSPATVEAGDVTVLISGLNVPMVVRPHSEGLQVVGMAEMDGVLNGEAWRPASDLEIFELI